MNVEVRGQLEVGSFLPRCYALGVKLRSTALVASPFTSQAISLTPLYFSETRSFIEYGACYFGWAGWLQFLSASCLLPLALRLACRHALHLCRCWVLVFVQQAVNLLSYCHSPFFCFLYPKRFCQIHKNTRLMLWATCQD